MKKRIIKIFIPVFIAANIFCIIPNAFASGVTENSIFSLTNAQRSKYSLAGLSWNYKLANAARAKAQDMINRDYFSHNTPDGKTPWTFITAAGYNYIYAGENLAMNFTVAEDVMDAWMASGGHRANILSGNFREIGVGVVTGEFQGYTTTMVVQMFGSQATSVYEKPAENSKPAVRSRNQSTYAPPAPNYSKAIKMSSDLIKKRIKDFSDAFGKLSELVAADNKKNP